MTESGLGRIQEEGESWVRLKGMSLSAGYVLAMGWVGYPWRAEGVWTLVST